MFSNLENYKSCTIGLYDITNIPFNLSEWDIYEIDSGWIECVKKDNSQISFYNKSYVIFVSFDKKENKPKVNYL